MQYTNINAETKIYFLRQMLLIRIFEEQIKELIKKNLVRGSTHLYIGEEAIAVGVCGALKKSDVIFSTHRGHGHCLAKGAKTDRMMAELLGKASGYCKGKGGSMHIVDFDSGVLGANAIVGAGLPLAVGAALTAQYKKTGQVVVCFFGDGAANQGTFHESLNLASIWNLPIVFVCENNLYAITVPASTACSVVDIAERASSYNMPGKVVDGNDVMAVFTVANKAVRRARTGKGPSLLECKTYRYEGHWIGDPIVYRTKEEEQKWKQKDPILKFADILIEEKTIPKDWIESIRQQIHKEIEQAEVFALTSPDPDPEEAFTDIYA